MGNEAVKLELIEWLTQLEDNEIIEYLKVVKDSNASGDDWWNDLTASQGEGIKRGLSDIDHGRITPNEEVKKKYGL